MTNHSWQSSGSEMRACNCIGPQNGQPVCPCAMRSVTIENGRYVRKEDLGPANPSKRFDFGSFGKV